MKKTIIIVAIAVLCIFAICLVLMIMLMPAPVEPSPVNIYTSNSLISTLGLEKPNKAIERLFVIKTYQGEVPFEEMLKLAQVGGVEYYDELDNRANDYLLITPFETNVTMEISSLKYDDYNDSYVPDEVIFKANDGNKLPDNYSLLLRYTRPSVPEYQIKLTKGEQTATYQLTNKIRKDGVLVPVTVIEFVKDDADEDGLRVDMIGTQINIVEDSSTNQIDNNTSITE